MAAAVKATYGPEVLAGIGAFGGLYDAAALKALANPVLVASTDGVGTKTNVAARLGRWETIGVDLVNHCINDILVQGARPLFFLDYVASAHLDPEQIAMIVGGVAQACQAAGCALLGGETAEMPGVYEAGEVDLAGTIVGLVERAQVIDGSRIRPGDVILGLPSNGLHTNGYSLARKVLDGLDWTANLPEIGGTLADALLAPHRAYLDDVRALWAAGVDIRGLAHITGGGLIENPPRIFPAGLGAIIRRGTWPEPPIFGLIQRLGQIDLMEMCRVFNMGLGMLVFVAPDQVAKAQAALPIYVVGEMVAGQPGVQIKPS
jgi:phosphoribosylformylglycinamidine cyclo-ligase